MDESTGMLSGGGAAASSPREGRKLWQYLSAVSACCLAIGVGTALAWTSPALPQLESSDSWLPLTKDESSWISSLLAIGAMLGALPSGALANALGRRRSLLLLALPFLLSWATIAAARTAWILYAARLLAGLGVGASCVLVPTYLSEIAEASVRGTLGALFQLFLTVGILLAFVAGALLSYAWLAAACAAVEVVFLATGLFLPESPAWLMGQGRRNEAVTALKRLRGPAYDVNAELLQLEKEADENASRRSSVFDLVRLPAPRRALVICSAGMVFQQLSGVNAVIFYTVEIFKAAQSSLDPNVAAVLVALVQCLMTVVAAGIVDRAGRKPLLMFSAVVMCASLVALGLFFKLRENGSGANIGWLPLVSLILFMIAFSVGMGPIPWMLMGELFTVEHKGNASSLAVMLNWFLVFLVTKTFPILTELLNSSLTFWMFAVIMGLAAVFTLLVVPETKGKTIQEIQAVLSGGGKRTGTTA